jgi:hypothetical protein
VCRRSLLNGLEQEQLGPVKVSDHRHIGSHAGSGGVERGQVMQVQEIGLIRAGLTQDLPPGSDEMLIGGVVDCGKDPVGCAGAILVGGVQRGIGAQRVGSLQRGSAVDRTDVQVAEERAGVA